MENVAMKTDRHVIFSSGRLKSKFIVREQYLRTDISCQSLLCPEQCKNDEKTPMLPSDCTHYLIPCTDVVTNYLEILEFNRLVGILFLQTCLNDLGKRHYSRICCKIRDKNNKCIYFPNEFSFFTFKERNANETCSTWQIRAAVWYYNHLGGNIPIVLVTENEEIITEYQNKSTDIFVVSLGNYLTTFWPDLTSLYELYFSLNASLNEKVDSKSVDGEYEEYLSREILENDVSGKYHRGKLKVNKYHSRLEAYVSVSSSDSKSDLNDILISGMKNRNRAIHGDTVVVEILPRSEWKGRIRTLNEDVKNEENEFGECRPSGKVVGILQQGWRNYVATVQNDDEANSVSRRPGDSILVVPYDYRIPKIRIFTRQIETLINQRIVVRIDSWKTNSQYPNGHFVQILGPVGSLDTETSVLLIENGISTAPFSNGVMSEMPNENWELTEIKERLDLRENRLIFSIDPKGCEDVDDAMSIKNLPNGNWELGVHIADVTYFVVPDSLTDSEARNRSTTVYLADRRFDMIPRILNSNVCSLLSNVDRYAVSVLWELDSKYEVRKVNFARSVIKSAYQLSYEVADEIISKRKYEKLEGVINEFSNLDEKEKERKYSELRKRLLKLTDIARTLKSRRATAGALDLESVEVQFSFKPLRDVENENKEELLTNVYTKKSLEIHETVAEFMIFANHWVAKKMYERFPRQALLRHHPAAKQDQFKDLIESARVKGFHVDTSTNKSLANSLNQSVDPNDPVVNNLLRQLATRAMTSAEYFSSGESDEPCFSHYGLALEFYTHFTSPIRRYADVLVHRLLLACVDETEQMSHLMSSSELKEVCQHINTKHKAAQDVQKASQHLFQTLYFLNKDDEESTVVDAVIFSIRTNGVLVFIPKYGIKGPVYLKNKSDQVAFVINKSVEWIPGHLENESTSLTVKTNVAPQKYNSFDHITVKICVVPSHAHAHSFRLDLVSNCPLVTDFKRGQDEKLPNIITTKCEQDPVSTPSGHLAAINNSESSENVKNENLHNLLIRLKEMSLKCAKID